MPVASENGETKAARAAFMALGGVSGVIGAFAVIWREEAVIWREERTPYCEAPQALKSQLLRQNSASDYLQT